MSVTVEQILASDAPLTLDGDFIGACPCIVLIGDGFRIDTHCWRTGQYYENGTHCSCPYSGIHISGLDAATAQKVGEHIRDNNGWGEHTDWEIVVEGQQ